MSGFNPYSEWLLIAGSGVRPNHYQLLGLPAFAHEPAEINRAAQEKIRLIRTYQMGPQRTEALRIIGELSDAYACLSNPESKRAYDQQLRQATTLAGDRPATVSDAPPNAPPATPAIPMPPVADESSQAGPIPVVTANQRVPSPREVRNNAASTTEDAPDQTLMWPGNAEADSVIAGERVLHSPRAQRPEHAGARLGRFEVQGVLGEGAHGMVYLAYDPMLDRQVALKVPKVSSDGPASLERILREARAAARLRHPNLVAVYECHQSEADVYIASEYIAGTSLAARLEQGPPDFSTAADWIRQVAEGAAYAHGEGILHRDIKPANIMLGTDERPRLMDFGLARELTDDAGLSTDGRPVGTPAYMAPEQARGDHAAVGPHSDQYSLGVVLYELLTSQRPYDGTTYAVIAQLISGPPPAPRRLRPEIPTDLEAICLTAIAREPAARYPSLAEMADDLRRWLGGQPVRARPRAPRAGRKRAVVAAAVVALAAVFAGEKFNRWIAPLPVVGKLGPDKNAAHPTGADSVGIPQTPGGQSNAASVPAQEVPLKNAAPTIAAATTNAATTKDGPTIAVPTKAPPTNTVPTSSVVRNREAALWAIAAGGTVEIEIKPGDPLRVIDKKEGLPEGAFQLVAVRRPRLSRPGNDCLAPLEGLGSLKSLDLFENHFPEIVLQRIATYPALEELRLQRTALTDAGMSHLGRLKNLRILSIVDTGVTSQGAMELRGLTRLRELHMGNTRVKDAGLASLAAMGELEGLQLDMLSISDASIDQLSACPKLKWLGLSATRITDAGVAKLAGLTVLEILNLQETAVSDAAVAHLLRMPSLKTVLLKNTHVTANGVFQLKSGLATVSVDAGESFISEEMLRRIADASKAGKWVRVDSVNQLDLSRAGDAQFADWTLTLTSGRVSIKGLTAADVIVRAKLRTLDTRPFGVDDYFAARAPYSLAPGLAVRAGPSAALQAVYFIQGGFDGLGVFQAGGRDAAGRALPLGVAWRNSGRSYTGPGENEVSLAAIGRAVCSSQGGRYRMVLNDELKSGGIELVSQNRRSEFRDIEYLILDRPAE